MSLCDLCNLKNNPCNLYKDIIVVTCGRGVQNPQDETIVAVTDVSEPHKIVRKVKKRSSQSLVIGVNRPIGLIQIPKIDESELRKREKKRILDDIKKGRGGPDTAGLKKMYGVEDSQLIKDVKKALMKGG
ncbi:MAG: hypothetical protein BME93_05455 [Methanosarcinales archaeon Met12]|nr:MAG: hypothetical protein BME93_05455 [Methanosarcinales archaeon Met12]